MDWSLAHVAAVAIGSLIAACLLLDDDRTGR
jgi:hypothetical protein